MTPDRPTLDEEYRRILDRWVPGFEPTADDIEHIRDVVERSDGVIMAMVRRDLSAAASQPEGEPVGTRSHFDRLTRQLAAMMREQDSCDGRYADHFCVERDDPREWCQGCVYSVAVLRLDMLLGGGPTGEVVNEEATPSPVPDATEPTGETTDED